MITAAFTEGLQSDIGITLKFNAKAGPLFPYGVPLLRAFHI
jgi:hypothetical protein